MEKKAKVLMIDDESDIVHFFAKAFEPNLEVCFLSATTGRSGIALATRERPDIILLDLGMPDIDGEEVLAQVRTLLPECKIAVMTGWADPLVEEHVLAIGAHAFYEKPVDIEQVIQDILSWMAKEEP